MVRGRGCGKSLRLNLISEYERQLLQGIRLKVRYPLWREIDVWLEKQAVFLRYLKLRED